MLRPTWSDIIANELLVQHEQLCDQLLAICNHLKQQIVAHPQGVDILLRDRHAPFVIPRGLTVAYLDKINYFRKVLNELHGS